MNVLNGAVHFNMLVEVHFQTFSSLVLIGPKQIPPKVQTLLDSKSCIKVLNKNVGSILHKSYIKQALE